MALLTSVVCYCLGVVLFAVDCHAMFFTDSKDNDYPRIGKRPLPATTLYRWLERPEDPRNSKYDFGAAEKESISDLLTEESRLTSNQLLEAVKSYIAAHTQQQRMDSTTLYETIMRYYDDEDILV